MTPPPAGGRALLVLRGGLRRPEDPLDAVDLGGGDAGGAEQLALLDARVLCVLQRVGALVAHRQAEHRGAGAEELLRQVPLVDALHGKRAGAGRVVEEAPGGVAPPLVDRVEAHAARGPGEVGVDRVVDDEVVAVLAHHVAARDGGAEAHPLDRRVEDRQRRGRRPVARDLHVRPARLEPLGVDQRPVLARITQHHALGVAGDDEPARRVERPHPRGPEYRRQHALAGAGRDVDHQVADLAPRHGLEVLADRVDVPVPHDRRVVDLVPGEPHELGEAVPPHGFAVLVDAEVER